MNEQQVTTSGATSYSPPPNSVLALHDIARVYTSGTQSLEIFRGVTNQIVAGEIVALVGPSGSGKSSLLHICGLLEAPSAGEVIINGRNCAVLPDSERTRIRREELGFVYQFHHLLPEFSAAENIVIPQLIAGKRRSEAEHQARRLLTMVGLAERLTHRPARLSGGEQQRVAIARALANQPSLLLADEPTGNLDPKTADLVFNVLVEICRARGVAALIATHNLQIATRMDRTWLLHEGKLIDAGKLKP
ncbi:MAG: ATP-binding cassette domain-containing protein [Alphaproteobacteria bacterium]|nr:ATP-binding cassette domain-containing protein [Alphaproteobacteria bacterium]